MHPEKNIKLKICGMRDPANILEVAALRPDYMGLIFYPQSPRYVGKHFALPASLPAEIERVGVFVNETTTRMRSIAERHRLGFVQLHGNETAGQCMELRHAGLKVIKVFSVDETMDFRTTRAYADGCDYFLFDTKGKYFGGNARSFDWNILDRYDQQLPFFLSGGLSMSNVPEIGKLEGMNLHAIDINSGVESAPALKDIGKIREVKKLMDNI
jgi:phosphoribosylanthranilate isomerase